MGPVGLVGFTLSADRPILSYYLRSRNWKFSLCILLYFYDYRSVCTVRLSFTAIPPEDSTASPSPLSPMRTSFQAHQCRNKNNAFMTRSVCTLILHGHHPRGVPQPYPHLCPPRGLPLRAHQGHRALDLEAQAGGLRKLKLGPSVYLKSWNFNAVAHLALYTLKCIFWGCSLVFQNFDIQWLCDKTK
jgi:hypothetical protein